MSAAGREGGTTFRDLKTNLVPYSQMHFLLPSYSPFRASQTQHQKSVSLGEMSDNLFKNNYQMASCDLNQGQYMACSLSYRGDVIQKDVVSYLSTIKHRYCLKFADWCSTGFKVSIDSTPLYSSSPVDILSNSSKSCTMLTNTTAICKAFDAIAAKFDKLYSKQAFVHWFVM